MITIDVWGSYQNGTLDEWGNRVFPLFTVNEWGDYVPPNIIEGGSATTSVAAYTGSFVTADTVGGKTATTTATAHTSTIEVVRNEWWDGSQWVGSETFFDETSTDINVLFGENDYNIAVAVEDSTGDQSTYSSVISITVSGQTVLGAVVSTTDIGLGGSTIVDAVVLGATVNTVDGVKLQEGVDFINSGDAALVLDNGNHGVPDITPIIIIEGKNIELLERADNGLSVVYVLTPSRGLEYTNARPGQALGGQDIVRIDTDPEIDDRLVTV